MYIRAQGSDDEEIGARTKFMMAEDEQRDSAQTADMLF